MKGALVILALIINLALLKSTLCYGAGGTGTGPLTTSPVSDGPQEGSKAYDKITRLKGQRNGVKFDQYAGYVTVDPFAGRALFYYFAESQNPSIKPLVIWLNGGPGCSSLGAGAMMELGPFRVERNGKKLQRNPYAWNNVANVLFLDAQVGAGFSYSNDTSDYGAGDEQTVADTYRFLFKWLERFPEYKNRELFLTGQSYAGHYVPELAQLILKYNKMANQTLINLKGIAIGNPYLDRETQFEGAYEFLWTKGIISDEIFEGILSTCNYSSSSSPSDKCLGFQTKAELAMGNINPYNIQSPLCRPSSSQPTRNSMSVFDSCSQSYVSTYLNTPQVQQSFHAYHSGIDGVWTSCKFDINVESEDQPDTVLPIINELTKSGIRVWIYSGVLDSVVPVIATTYAIFKMQLPEKSHPWYYQGKVGGDVEEFQNLTFVTVEGAGHFVPSDQPGRALSMFSSFLEGKLP